jgi:hypothetical protein
MKLNNFFIQSENWIIEGVHIDDWVQCMAMYQNDVGGAIR